MKRTAFLSALLLILGATWARAQDVPPPPPPPDTADTGTSENVPPPPPPPDTADTGTTPAAPTTTPVVPGATTPSGPISTSTEAELRAEIAALKAQVQAMQQRLDQIQGTAPGAPTEAPETSGEPGAPAEAANTPGTTGGGRSLLLPDISFIGTAIGHLSTDRRDPDRTRMFLDSGELSIQSYVYPGVKADAFITASRPNFNFQVEEAYLTVLSLRPGLSLQLGKRKVPFDRVNQLHPHSWLYVTQPYVLKNLVADESLTGQGAALSYLLPTRGKLFAQLDAGLWNSAEPGVIQPRDTTDIRTGPGAAFEDRFQTLRLWTGLPIGEYGEFELGGSLAHGKGQRFNVAPDLLDRPETTITGLDVSYRHFGTNVTRTLLRGEYLWHSAKSDLERDKARGFYLLADQRVDPHHEFGLRYDWSQFPFAPGLHESGISGIFTNQLTEQTYLRLQLTHGDRPGKSNVNEAWFEWVWGVGPHTHNLE